MIATERLLYAIEVIGDMNPDGIPSEAWKLIQRYAKEAREEEAGRDIFDKLSRPFSKPSAPFDPPLVVASSDRPRLTYDAAAVPCADPRNAN